MANSEETMISIDEEDMFDMEEDVDVLHDHHGGGGGGMTMYMSRLSIETFDGGNDADEEYSDDEKEGKHLLGEGHSSDSDKELVAAGKKMTRRDRRRMVTSERWRERANWDIDNSNFYNSFSGESDQGAGLMVITRPKGGRRSLCMDMEEVKACYDLGFELEHQRMLEMPPSAISLSASTGLDASSGGDSPIASWRISSPGDDPRDVKARLKVWAQAVALASTSRYIC